ncbi:hypothetical protein KNO15_19710 [Leifsonia shinshuensis]|nr:hypothetical protein [Leifsonia shinshuensis]MCI0158935.1 hypothetical protein [Leifsonia shinshuensis]
MRTMGTTTVETGELSRLPAGPILMRLRRLLLTTAGAAAAYTLLSTGSVGTCTDTPNAGGSGAAQVTCANLVLHPSWIVYAAFAVILFVAIGRVARQASTVADALRTLDRAAIVIGALAVLAGLIGMAWLFLVPHEALTSGGTLIYPFPFSSPELTITHNP